MGLRLCVATHKEHMAAVCCFLHRQPSCKSGTAGQHPSASIGCCLCQMPACSSFVDRHHCTSPPSFSSSLQHTHMHATPTPMNYAGCKSSTRCYHPPALPQHSRALCMAAAGLAALHQGLLQPLLAPQARQQQHTNRVTRARRTAALEAAAVAQRGRLCLRSVVLLAAAGSRLHRSHLEPLVLVLAACLLGCTSSTSTATGTSRHSCSSSNRPVSSSRDSRDSKGGMVHRLADKAQACQVAHSSGGHHHRRQVAAPGGKAHQPW